MNVETWHLLGQASPELFQARLELHWALQVAAAVGFTFVPSKADLSHTNFGWSDQLGALVTHETPEGFRAGLRLADLTLLLMSKHQQIESSFALAGNTLEDGYAWLERAIVGYPGRPSGRVLTRPDHQLPPHPVAEGSSFTREHPALFEELARWYANADALLQRVGSAHPGAAPVRCWPHHFDIATLITLDEGKEPEAARSIGVGMTPGDGSYPEPYWYVTPWPYPATPLSTALEGQGKWHTEGWLGAVLPASRLAPAPTAAQQASQVADFLRSAIAACEQTLL